MNRFAFIVASFALAFGALGQTRIKDLTLMTDYTTNTSLAVDDSTYGVRRVTLPLLANTLTNYLPAFGGGSGDVTEQELTDGLAGKVNVTNGTAINLTITDGVDVTGDIVGSALLQGATLTITSVPTNRVLFLNSGGVLDDVVGPTPAEISYIAGLESSAQTQLDGKQGVITGSATTIDSETISASRAVVTDGSGKIAAATTTSTEIGYVNGVTSAIQTQLDGKQATITGSATTIDTETMTASRALVTDGSGKVAVSDVTATELSYLDGVTSGIQAQIDAIDGGDSAIFITPQDYGADGTDTTDDRSAFEQAWGAATSAQPKKILYIPEGTYYFGQNNLQLPKGLHIIGGKGAILKPGSFPSGNFNTQEKQNALIRGDDNVTIEGELTFDMRNNDDTFTQNTAYKFAALAWREKTNFVVRGVTIKNAYDNPLWIRQCVNPVVQNVTVYESAQAMHVQNSSNPEVSNFRAFNIKMTNDDISGVAVTFFNNKFTRVDGMLIDNVVSSNRPSQLYFTAVNLFGEDFGQFSGIRLDGVDSGTTSDSVLGINLDGGVWNTITDFTIKGYHHNAGSGLQIEGAQNFNIVNGLIEGVKTYGPGMSTAGGDGIYMTEWGIESADKEGYIWRDFGHQWRGRSLPARGRFTNVKVRGFHNGVRPTGSDLFFDGCEFIGANFANVRILAPVSSGEYYSRNSVPHPYGNIVFSNCEIAWGKSYGVALSGGDQIKFVDCNIHDNNQDGSSYEIGSPSSASGSIGVGSTATVIYHGLSGVSTDAYKGLYAWFPEDNVSALITGNSSTTFTISGDTGATLSSGESFVINRSLLGRVTLQGCQIYKSTPLALTNKFSLNPTQDISVASTPFSIEGTDTHMLNMSQRVILKGVLSGSADLTARVLYKDSEYPDRVWLECISPTTGTFATSGDAIVAGTGTMTYVDNPTSFEHSGRLTVTGSGTSFGTEMDGSWWYKAASEEWRLSSYALTDTSLLINKPYAANFSGKAFDISKFTITSPTLTGAAIDIRNTPGVIYLNNTTVYDELVSAASGGHTDRYYPGMAVNSTTAPNARSKLALNSKFPRLSIGPNYVFANTSSTTVTNFNGGTEGMEINILGDANTTLGFAESDTSLVGNGGSNKALGASKLVRGTYRSGKWYLTVIE